MIEEKLNPINFLYRGQYRVTTDDQQFNALTPEEVELCIKNEITSNFAKKILEENAVTKTETADATTYSIELLVMSRDAFNKIVNDTVADIMMKGY